MSSDQFAEVARQLEEVLSKLNQVRDLALRRSMLSQMRLLLVEADRLAGDEPQVREIPADLAHDG